MYVVRELRMSDYDALTKWSRPALSVSRRKNLRRGQSARRRSVATRRLFHVDHTRACGRLGTVPGLVPEKEGCRRRSVTAFRHADHRAIDRVEVRDLVGTIPAEIIRLDKIRSVGIVSLYERWLACHFGDSDATTQIVETVGTEEQEKGVTPRALPYAMTGAPRDGRRRSGRAAAFYQDAAAHIGGHALNGCDHRKRRRRARHDTGCA